MQRLQRLGRGFRELGRRFGRIEPQRRNPHALAGLQTVLAVGALAVDAQLAFANDALDVGERQSGKARLQEAVDAHVVLVRRDDDGLDLGRKRRCLDDRLLGLRRPNGFAARGAAAAPARAWRRGGKPADARLCSARLRAAIRARALRAIARGAGLRRGLLTRRLMMVCGSRSKRCVAQNGRIVTAKYGPNQLGNAHLANVPNRQSPPLVRRTRRSALAMRR